MSPARSRNCICIIIETNAGLEATYEIAHGVDAPRSANMVLLGAYNRLRSLFSLDELSEAMKEFLPSWRHGFVEMNRRVLDAVEELDLESYRVGSA